MRNPPVQNMHGLYATLGSVERPGNLRNHPARDGTVGALGIDSSGRQFCEQLSGFVEHASNIGEHQQFFCLECN